MKNKMKKIFITAFVFLFLFSPSAEASRFDFGKNIIKRQKANVISSLESSDECKRIDKISENLSPKIQGLASEKNNSLIEKTSKLQETWAKEDFLLNEKRLETRESIESKFNKLEQKISKEKLVELQIFENKVFSAIEKRNDSIEMANEEYRDSIISYLSEYNLKKDDSLKKFEKNIEDKILEAKSSCQNNKNFKVEDIEKAMREENKNIQNGLAGDHFREFIETKRKERDSQIKIIQETFQKEIEDAKTDFTGI